MFKKQSTQHKLYTINIQYNINTYSYLSPLNFGCSVGTNNTEVDIMRETSHIDFWEKLSTCLL